MDVSTVLSNMRRMHEQVISISVQNLNLQVNWELLVVERKKYINEEKVKIINKQLQEFTETLEALEETISGIEGTLQNLESLQTKQYDEELRPVSDAIVLGSQQLITSFQTLRNNIKQCKDDSSADMRAHVLAEAMVATTYKLGR